MEKIHTQFRSYVSNTSSNNEADLKNVILCLSKENCISKSISDTFSQTEKQQAKEFYIQFLKEIADSFANEMGNLPDSHFFTAHLIDPTEQKHRNIVASIREKNPQATERSIRCFAKAHDLALCTQEEVGLTSDEQRKMKLLPGLSIKACEVLLEKQKDVLEKIARQKNSSPALSRLAEQTGGYFVAVGMIGLAASGCSIQ